jgi:glycosyltransferase involved in cell wall biosynthesis
MDTDTQPGRFGIRKRGGHAPLRIGIDARVLAETAPMGVARCTAALLGTMAQLAPEHAYYLYLRRTPVSWGPFTQRPFQQQVLAGNALLNSPLIWQQVYFPWQAYRDQVDVVVSPYYCGPLVSPAPQIIVLHDISFSRFPQDFPAWIRFKPKLLARPSSLSAARVVTISEFSRQEIVQTYGLAPDKVVVVPLGREDAFWRQPEPEIKIVPEPERPLHRPPLGAPFFLFVGSLLPRRQVDTVIRALARLSTPYHLVVVGEADPDKGAALIEVARRCHMAERIHCLGHVSDAELTSLYQRAVALVFPSTYEGFGLPLLEAMSRGLPVVAWDIPVTREVVGDAAILVQSGDEAGLAVALDLLGTQPQRRHALGQAGQEQATRFSWQQSAEKFLTILDEVADSSRI